MLGTYQNGDSKIAVINEYGGVLAPANSEQLFYNLTNCEHIDISNLNTQNVTNMTKMFYNDSKLKSINMTNINTAKVTNMSYLFTLCSNLISLDLTSFNTKKVQYMVEMFSQGTNITKATVGCDWSYESIKQATPPYGVDGTEYMYANAGISSVTKVCQE